MRVLFTREAWVDYVRWQETDSQIVARINRLIADIQRSPFDGIGKPEALRLIYTGWWSRRVATEHRLVYRVSDRGDDQQIEILSCRYHYSRRG